MRALFRLIFADPGLLFAGLVIATIGGSLVAFVLAERRARAIAELAQDDQAKSSQGLRLLILGMSSLSAIAAAGWWVFYRVHTEPQRVLIAVTLEPSAGELGSFELARELGSELEQLGLDPVGVEGESIVGLDDAALAERARDLEARWVVQVVVRVDKTLALGNPGLSDYVLSAEAALIDSETGERWLATDPPLRSLLWGESPDMALVLNANYLADRLTMPIVTQLGEREPLQRFADPDERRSTEEAERARKLERFFDRSDKLARGLALRERDHETALAREPEHRAGTRRTRLGDILAEEYMIGTAFDGRPIVLVDSKHVSVVPDQLGYVVTSEGEALELVDGPGRTLVFEHYNFYGASEVSADGRTIWTTLAGHDSTKTLATLSLPDGEYAPVYTALDEYMTNPQPAPDGSRALVYARPDRYAATAIDVIDRAGHDRRRVVSADEVDGRPAWSQDGKTVYVPIDAWSRIVAIDMATLDRTHLLGQPPPSAGIVDLRIVSDAAIDDAAIDGEPSDGEPSDGEPSDGEPSDDLPALEDPRATSRFPALALGHDGSYLFVLEDAVDGGRWVGRFDLVAGDYRRLAALDAQWLVASPNAERVAVQVRDFTQRDDPRPGDDELLLLGPRPQDVSALTLDSEDDELIGWSRDGTSVFGIQRSIDPGARDRPVVRVYRYELESP